ncbi:efflux RND transporter periplasmic adaptor subunit [Pseudomonas sp. G2-4]|uniref:efflux RND transporter periplasmic adaptor subunit n=1 Tax=Pseudomonas sp. G2-4 TaxID=1506334 RepID=UPI0024BAD0BA|nr:efflux RND transporter periplasmic adaptor subunit [Pseudomonas sp. G2-4]WHS58351.1 efflux RND transporter periplasmic adaptor subunit [Pseudomonas sp. G2-4]
MNSTYFYVAAIAGIALTVTGMAITVTRQPERNEPVAARPALTVTLAQLQFDLMPIEVSANGNIMAWQEASIGTEADGLRLVEVRVNVGDVVRRGQVLAVFAAHTVTAELAQSRAATAEALAAQAEATANAGRARELRETGAMSAQQIQQYLMQERAAQARLEGARAVEKTQHLRLVQTQVLAPDNGVISARSATVGAVLPSGQELYRMILGNRLEWRAEVAAADVAKLKAGQTVRVKPAGGEPITGTLRMIAPLIDTQTRNAMVYVDLPQPGAARAGMFARGEFEIETRRLLTLPQTSVVLRDGFSHVFRIGAQSRVVQTKVTTGRRTADRVEIVSGLDLAAQVVAAGGSFLNDGDLVRVVAETSPGDHHPASSPGIAPIVLK